MNVAFKAMTLHRIGWVEEANGALEQLRALRKLEQHLPWDAEAQALLAEAEKLIAGEKQ